ncbi:MAG: UvrD-helicase domain-containing protein [Calditrichaceae bacterium]
MLVRKILDELNESQQLAVTAPRQPVLMIAGPGTGKTRALIARIVYEVHHYSIPPENILALTFSNKAAGEIKLRLTKILDSKAERIRTGTIHAFCLDILRKYHEPAGLNKYFSVCDDDYQNRLLKSLISGKVRENPERVAKGIQLAFSNFLLKGNPLPSFSAMIYENYETHLQKHGLIDYNQILVKTLALLKENKDILEQYRFLYQSILVDEFQDTDVVQYQIIKLLAEKHRNIFVVADDDQSIYSWRGANPENIRQYMDDFLIKEPVFLEINYRSGEKITQAAQAIVKSTDRIEPGKNIIPDAQKKDLIQVALFEEEGKEIEFIVKKIDEWHTAQKADYSEIAIIYPQHRFGDQIAVRLLKERIPYQQASGRNLLDQPKMARLLSYLKLIRNPIDNLVIEELVEVELGHHIYKQIQNYQNLNEKSTFRKALNDFSTRSEIGSDLRRRINAFIGNIANLVNLKSFYKFDSLVAEILNSSQDTEKTILEHNVEKIADVTLRENNKARNPKAQIWIYHSNEKLSFVACEMLQLFYQNRVHVLKNENLININPGDVAILLSPMNDHKLSCEVEILYDKTDEKRQGSLSTLFRIMQSKMKQSRAAFFRDYVVFDLETTGRDPEKCGIVEIAAVRVRDSKIIDEFQTLVNPGMPIEPEAQAVHHITEEDVRDAPDMKTAVKKMIGFAGKDLLIAHNGYSFDFKIMDRLSRSLTDDRLPNIRYDSLVFARHLYPSHRNSIDALAERFELDPGNRHRALDDVRVLHEIIQIMHEVAGKRESKTAGENLTEYVALGNLLEDKLVAVEDKIFFASGARKLLSPYSEILSKFASRFNYPEAELREKIRSRAEQAMPGITSYDMKDDVFKRMLEMADQFKHLPVEQAIAEFLSFILLINPQDGLGSIDAVSLLTYHAAKGLEFDHVIIMGLEDDTMPSFFAYKKDDQDDRPVAKKLEEQKRLLYVGITRARKEVILTAVKNRFGKMQKSSPFLKEMTDLVGQSDLPILRL